MISCHVYRGKSYERYFRAVEAIMLEHGGRPHWGKMHALEAAQLRSSIPRGAVLELRARLDRAVVCVSLPRESLVSPTHGEVPVRRSGVLSLARRSASGTEGLEALDDPRDLLGGVMVAMLTRTMPSSWRRPMRATPRRA